MERFAFKIDKVLRANLYKICRLCGIDNPDKVPIHENDLNSDVIDADAEPELSQKIQDLIGFAVSKDDKMPQFVCTLCVDKINDFYEFREMCFSTDQQTRKLLGIKPAVPKKSSQFKVEVKNEPTVVDKRGKKRKNEEFDNKTDIKVELDHTGFPMSKKKQRVNEELGKGSSNKKKKIQAFEESSSGAQPWGKKKLRFTEVGDNTSPNTTVPLTKKQMRMAMLKQTEQTEIKPEIKDEPSAAEPPTTSTIAQAEKLKQMCVICEQRFPTKLKLDRHKAHDHSPNIAKFYCSTCNEEVSKNGDIKSHQLWHKLSKTPYTCGLCGETFLTVNLYTRHLSNHTQKLLTPILVYDRECSMCHETFVTNFLYNTHPCALRSKKCGGCNRKMKTDVEYQLHAPYCDKAYLVASKHVGGNNEAAIKIKNENDVEADVEGYDRGICSVPLSMMPVVSLTRLAIQPNQKVNVADTSALAIELAADSAPGPKSKNRCKKGLSKKDLNRVNDLLKSTMDTLVSIKHEPEINVDAEPHPTTPQPDAQTHLPSIVNDDGGHMDNNKSNNPAAEGDHDDDADDSGMHFGDDDFHNHDDDSNHSDFCAAAAMVPIVQMQTGNNVVVKQEPRDDAQNEKQPQMATNVHAAIRIKTEIPENINDVNTASQSKVPVLKLKITKEHGTLNVVNENKEKSEKKKKKKKRKDAEKAAAPSDKSREIEPGMPLPGIVHIKQERIDEEYYGGSAVSTTESLTLTTPAEATIMTSIPRMQFQISSVVSGVEFDDNAANNNESEATDTADESQEIEQQDVKPNRDELDRLLAEKSNEMPEKEDATTKQKRQQQKTVRKSVATKSTSQRKVTSVAKTKTPIEKMPQIVAVSGGIDLPVANNKEREMMPPPVRIKTEPRDDDYHRNEEHAVATVGAENPTELTIENDDVCHDDEQSYISGIDFSNIKIKQEKDIDVSESQLTATHFSDDSAYNGSSLEIKERASGSSAVENEEDSEEEDDGEELDDEDEEMPSKEEEEREYREIDWPPLLSVASNVEAEALPAAPIPSIGITIANVCSQAADIFTKDHNDKTKSAEAVSETSTPLQDEVDAPVETHQNAAAEEAALEQQSTTLMKNAVAAPVGKQQDAINAVRQNDETADNDIEAASVTLQGDTIESNENRDTQLIAVPAATMPIERAENIADVEQASSDDETSETSSDVDTNNGLNNDAANINEEQQNILNHEKCESTAATAIAQKTTPTNTLPQPQLESYLEDISSNSCSIFSSITNENSTNAADGNLAAATEAPPPPPTISQTSNHEETENLYNENRDAALNQHSQLYASSSQQQQQQTHQHHQQQQQQRALLLDNSNVNEIAENNNNANIERELLDDVNHQQQQQAIESPSPSPSASRATSPNLPTI